MYGEVGSLMTVCVWRERRGGGGFCKSCVCVCVYLSVSASVQLIYSDDVSH